MLRKKSHLCPMTTRYKSMRPELRMKFLHCRMDSSDGFVML